MREGVKTGRPDWSQLDLMRSWAEAMSVRTGERGGDL